MHSTLPTPVDWKVNSLDYQICLSRKSIHKNPISTATPMTQSTRLPITRNCKKKTENMDSVVR
ncbi:hypothetical protein RB13300 [Rhodopirellula baltica SH 1]|uniref:Uncharacterized protein n=1 Tax=Rhodopirellula baltica (strain DSM 10527 / NCIMB 13988 / SH1) TaxID=243090 RepID=Q7UHC7_RHOBA|nr:hypothetical protein RB13300 [Rhodopirellula baltica SH 1]